MTSYEMLWDCEFCGTEKLLGLTHRHCPACGGAQDPERRYFPAPGEEIEVANHVFTGVDKECPACETPNAAKAAYCVNCGHNMDETKQVDLVQDPADAPKPPTDPPAKGGGAGKAFGAVGVIGVALVALLLVCGVGGLVT